jgi:hypothetical protein
MSMPAYARVIAWGLAREWQNKRLLGKPYLKYGQCFGLWGFTFEVGGLLGARHANDLDAFGNAFLGFTGPAGAMRTFFGEAADHQIALNGVSNATTFFAYVQAEFLRRISYQGDPSDYFLQHGMDKMPLDTAAEVGWQYAQQGAAIGAIAPALIRGMFETTYAPSPAEQWEQARAAGLDIPATQTQNTFLEAQTAHNGGFMEYCREHRSDLFGVLNK